MRTLLTTANLPKMLETPDAERSSAPQEIDGQVVFVHKRTNLFPRGKSRPS